MASSTAEKVFDDLETYEERVTFSLKRILQIGVEKWKKEIAEAFKLEALILKAERKNYEEKEFERRSSLNRREAVQEAIDNENFIKEILDKHSQFEADKRVAKVWQKMTKN
jgi:vesicle coat complex subunit